MRSIVLLFTAIGFLIASCNGSNPTEEPVIEGYQPEEPIEFPHDIHSGVNKIDCKVCHSPGKKVPVDVCMQCHKQVTGDGNQLQKDSFP